MWERILREFAGKNRGKIAGTLIGLLVGLLVIIFGFFRAVFILACVGGGYYFGKRLDNNNENLAEMLDRILPPEDQ